VNGDPPQDSHEDRANGGGAGVVQFSLDEHSFAHISNLRQSPGLSTATWNRTRVAHQGAETSGGDGALVVLEREGSRWTERLRVSRRSGRLMNSSIAFVDGHTLLVSEPHHGDDRMAGSGRIRQWNRGERGWTEARSILPPTPMRRGAFGNDFATCGSLVVATGQVPARNSQGYRRDAFVFERSRDRWNHIDTLRFQNDTVDFLAVSIEDGCDVIRSQSTASGPGMHRWTRTHSGWVEGPPAGRDTPEGVLAAPFGWTRTASPIATSWGPCVNNGYVWCLQVFDGENAVARYSPEALRAAIPGVGARGVNPVAPTDHGFLARLQNRTTYAADLVEVRLTLP
jgi:hypothetical protein